jgi:uncharacterized protein (TIGR03435 family)
MLRVAVGSVLILGAARAQVPVAQSEPPHFEVVSIRPSSPEPVAAGFSGCATTPGLVRCINVTLKRAISGANGIGLDRVLGGPAWTESDHFQITGKTDQPIGEDALNEMLKTLLAERFRLKVHRENQPGETLVMEVAKNGPKFQPAGDPKTSVNNGHGVLEASSITMRIFTEILSRDLNLPVLDRTGLKGAFKFTVRWNADRPRVAAPDDPAGDLKWEISTALAQQLGLTLKSQRMPVEMLVIDRAEKPSEN